MIKKNQIREEIMLGQEIQAEILKTKIIDQKTIRKRSSTPKDRRFPKPPSDKMFIYTDGAVSNNKRDSKDSVGGIGVYFGPDDPRNISEKFLQHPVTNQRAEIWAIVRALQTIIQDKLHLKTDLSITLYTDSMYSQLVINGEWKAKQNLDLVSQAWKLMKQIHNLEIKHIRAHTGKDTPHAIGNAKADELARLGKSN